MLRSLIRECKFDAHELPPGSQPSLENSSTPTHLLVDLFFKQETENPGNANSRTRSAVCKLGKAVHLPQQLVPKLYNYHSITVEHMGGPMPVKVNTIVSVLLRGVQNEVYIRR